MKTTNISEHERVRSTHTCPGVVCALLRTRSRKRLAAYDLQPGRATYTDGYRIVTNRFKYGDGNCVERLRFGDMPDAGSKPTVVAGQTAVPLQLHGDEHR